jgi:probable poly-beta-1,6-N-acetyl-D-glucosamine export protein
MMATATGVNAAAEVEVGSRARLVEADAVRSFAALGVIAIHAVQWLGGTSALDHDVWTATDTLSRFAVPVFVILSGLLLQVGYAHRPRGWAFLRRRFLRSLVPWLVWAPIYSLAGFVVNDDIAKSGGYLNWWQYGTGHLWFLLLIPQLYVLFAIWPRQHLWLWAAVALSAQMTLGALRLLLPLDGNSLAAQPTLWHGFLLFPYWMGYFALGIAACDWYRRPRRPVAPWLIGSGAAVILSGFIVITFDWSFAAHGDLSTGTGAFLNPLLVPFVLSVTMFATVSATALVTPRPRAAAWARRFSEWSLGIYIVHPLMLNAITGPPWRPLLQRGLPVSAIAFILVLVTTFAVSALVTRALAATPLAATVGATRQPWRGSRAPAGVPAP